jgi:hypothetical protein
MFKRFSTTKIMQDNINNNKPDAFSEMMKQKLENHQLPVDLNDWNAIEKRLNKKGKRKIIPWWMWLPMGSAALLALLFTMRSFNETPDYAIKSSSRAVTQQAETPKRYAVQQLIAKTNVSGNQISKTPTASVKQKHTSAQNTNVSVIDFPHIMTVNFDSTANEINNGVAATTLRPVEKESIAQVTVQQNDSVLNKQEMKKTVLDPNPDEMIAAVDKQKSKHNNWMLAASYGSQGNVDLASNNGGGDLISSSPNFYDGKTLSAANPNYTSIMATNDFTKKTYNDPLSFGLTVRKQLNKTLSLESGLVYTYLLSTFENPGMQRSEAKLHLHYIGIPVNLITELWENSKWEVYLSTGFMAEKGIQSLYVQSQYFGAEVVTTTAKTNINGIQWSINGGVGVSYKIKRQLGIYFEPKFSRYFQNNQPVSARTDHPFVFGLSAGLRIGF